MVDLKGSFTVDIKCAAWGSGKSSVDVTDAINAIIKQNRFSFIIDTKDLGPDPALGVKKSFSIVYSVTNDSNKTNKFVIFGVDYETIDLLP